MRYLARLLHTPSLRHANGMDCNIIVHKLTLILIFTELDSRQCKPFSKASQESNLRNNVMEARFILFSVTNPVDLMVRQMDMIGNVLQQLELVWEIFYYHNSEAIPKGILKVEQYFLEEFRFEYSKICMKCEQEILTLGKCALQHVYHKAET